QGARDELEWAKLDAVLSTQSYLELPAGRYRHAARLYFEMRRQGCTVRSPIDCCIAQVALSHRVLLLHRDKDFTAIAQHCALSQRFVDWP
ncbi:MAG: type II toxin-antitoxin system VapC family toxin, partial [Polyangiales bacterium]